MTPITVIMPIYNTKTSYLQQAIDSILNQTFKDFKFIILNDSPENLAIKNIIKSYKDNRIKYYENHQNLGIAQSYNKLIYLCDTKYIALMNHDDISLPNRLKEQYEYLEQHQSIGLVGTAYKKFGKLNRFKRIFPSNTDALIRAQIFFKSPIHHPTIMFRRKIIEQHKIRYNEKYISLNDRNFLYDFSKYSKLANLDKVLYKYRFHNNMTSKLQKRRIKEEQKDFHKYWLKDNNIELSNFEQYILDNYTTQSHNKIKDKKILYYICNILEKMVLENQNKNFLPHKEFKEICAIYLIKRSINASLYGHICSNNLLEQTFLPIKPKPILSVLNYINSWRIQN